MKKQLLLCLLALVVFGCEGNRPSSSSHPVNGNPPMEHADTVPEKIVEQPISSEEAHPVYVLSDEFGERFLLLSYFGEDKNPQVPDGLDGYKYVIYNGCYYPVLFEGFQLEDAENNTYRETYLNFDNLSGWLFKMQSGKLLEHPVDQFDAVWSAPLLVDAKFKEENTVYALSNYENGRVVRSELPEALTAVFETRYGREIYDGWCNAVFGENNEYQFINIQFENKGTEALGISALLKDGEIVAVIEDPAEWNEESVWRVDDGGEFGGISIDFVTVKDGVLTLYTSNSGPEGTYYQNYVLEGNELLPGDVTGSFYQSPY